MVKVSAGIVYGSADGRPLLGDLYVPVSADPAPVVVYVHGGGFARGTRGDHASTRLRGLAAHGIAVFSIDYRLAPDAIYPAPLRDLREAVRWIRRNGADRGVDATRVGVWGSSAGGSLAALVGLGAPVAPEESVPDDCAVDAVVVWFPLVDLVASASRSPLEGAILPFQFEAALVGAAHVEEVISDARFRELAAFASPLRWVSPSAPPFLIFHGDRDRVTPLAQSMTLHDALVREGTSSSLMIVGGAGHEDPAFEAAPHLAAMAGWLRAELQPASLSAGSDQ